MKTPSHLVFLALLSCASVTLAQEPEDLEFHPGDAEVQQLQRSCAVSDVGMVSLQEKVLAVIADWRKATAAEGPLSAMRKLDGFFDPVRGGLSGKKSIYVLCVEKAVRQFVEARREKPQVLVASGNSEPLQRAAFASEEEIWHRGCQQAEADAMAKLRLRCGERVAVQTNSDCAQESGPVRTYASQVSGECRLR